MNWEEYKGALDHITPPPALKDRIRNALDAPAPVSRPRRRRAGLTVLAAAAVAACTFLAPARSCGRRYSPCSGWRRPSRCPLPREKGRNSRN